MKKIIFFVILVLILNFAGFPQDKDLNLGRIYFPKAFIHAGTDYNKGVYLVSITEKDGFPWFKVFNKKNELLFEEMAVIKPYEGKVKRFKYRMRKNLLSRHEYFRIKVIKPDNVIIAFFLIKK